MYLGHRSRPTKEKEMLKMQDEEYFREQKLKEELEKRETKEMEKAEKGKRKRIDMKLNFLNLYRNNILYFHLICIVCYTSLSENLMQNKIIK